MLNTYVMTIFLGIFSYNAGLAIFNLVPVPPLDGSKVLLMILPYRFARVYAQLSQQMGMFLLLFLSYTNLLSLVISPLISFLYSTAFRLAIAIGTLW